MGVGARRGGGQAMRAFFLPRSCLFALLPLQARSPPLSLALSLSMPAGGLLAARAERRHHRFSAKPPSPWPTNWKHRRRPLLLTKSTWSSKRYAPTHSSPARWLRPLVAPLRHGKEARPPGVPVPRALCYSYSRYSARPRRDGAWVWPPTECGAFMRSMDEGGPAGPGRAGWRGSPP